MSGVRGWIGIQGYYGYGNLGDEALLLALSDELRKLHDPNRIVVFTAEPEATRRALGLHAVSGVLPAGWGDWLRGVLGRSRRDFLRSVAAFRSLEWLLLGGGGVLKDMPSTSRHLLGLLGRIDRVKAAGKHVAALGMGAGPFHHPESVAAVRRTLQNVDLITVRDDFSRHQLVAAGVPEARVHVTADLAFLLDPRPLLLSLESAQAVVRESDRGPHIALCTRAWDLKQKVVLDSFAALVRFALEQLGATVWLVPFQVGGGEDDREGFDRLRQVVGEREGLRVVPGFDRPAEALAFLSRMDLVVGEKLHSLILALLCHTPVLGISYQPKVEGLFATLRHPEWCLPLADLTPERVVEGTRSIWENRASIRQELPGLVADMRERSRRNMTLLSESMTASSSA